MKFKFFSCLNPQMVRNKYTHEWIVVPCGECESCLLAKANDLLRRVDDETRLHKDVFFVTLSYRPEFVPTITIDSDGLVDGEPLENMPWYDLYVQSDDYRLAYPNKILHLELRDVQLFLKRLRTKISKYARQTNIMGDTRIRVYYIGEYGGTTKRPHYHLLFFFDNSEVALHFKHFVTEAWRVNVGDASQPHFESLGNVECERPISTCSSYVTAYLSAPASLPAILQFRAWKPFYHASSRPALGSGYFNENHIKDSVFGHSLTYLKETRKYERIALPYPKCFKNRFFPKLAKFDRWSLRQLGILYSLTLYCPYEFYRDEVGLSFKQYVQYLPDYLKNYNCAVSDVIERYLSLSSSYEDDALYRLCQISKKFVLNYRLLKQKFNPNFKILDYVALIRDYYVRLDYANLKSQLKFEEDYCSRPLCSSRDEWFLASLDPLFHHRGLSETALIEYSEQFNLSFSSDLEINPNFRKYKADILDKFNKRVKSHFDRDYLAAHPEFAVFHSDEI